MGDFLMPALGADMDEGTLVEWRVAPGDMVHRGDIVAVIDTEKSNIEVEVFEDGTVAQLLVTPGQTVAVGAPLARIAGTAEAGAAAPPVAPPPVNAAPEARAAGRPAGTSPTAGAPSPEDRRSPVLSPLVRRLADESHVDLGAITGTGVGGRITRADVERAAAASRTTRRPRSSPYARRRAAELGVDLRDVVPTGPTGAVIARDVEGRTGPRRGRKGSRSDRTRAAVGALMARSKREIPHFYLRHDVDLDATQAWIEAHNFGREPTDRLVPAALLLKAVALAARDHPSVNGSFTDEGFQPAGAVDLGIAVSLRGGGLVAPTLAGVDGLDLDDLMGGLSGLVERARRGTLRATDLMPSSLTVTNLGDQGADEVQGVIYPPQVALVGFGRIAVRPCVVEGQITARPMVTMTLAADHRAADGHTGSRFLHAIDRLLQKPEKLR